MKSKIEFKKADESSFDGTSADRYSADEVALVSQHDGKPLVSRSAVVWKTAPNVDDTRMLAQHAYVEKIFKAEYTYEPYAGNLSLCGRFSIAEDYETSVPVSQIKGEKLNEAACCKVCRRIYERHFG
jgi:hypothetical protein